MSFIDKFEKISISPPRLRGLQFEKLFYEIFESYEILIEKSFKNDDGSQQIDGAVEINHRIFLIEIKWENSETLAASKLYSFLGKINSKIDGTLGIFISYNELSNNFINSVRSGLKQNCIIIHGEDNINAIIEEKVNIKDYIWYLYKQAATKSRISIPVEEFIDMPISKKDSTSPLSKWNIIFNELISDGNNTSFNLVLVTNYNKDENLSEKLFNIIPSLSYNRILIEKLKILIEYLAEHENEKLTKAISLKLKNKNFWQKYINEQIVEILSGNITIESDDAEIIKNIVIEHLINNYGNWDEENIVSIVLDLIYDSLTDQAKYDIANAYAIIYCDANRRKHYPQKKFANRLFSDISKKQKDLFEIVKPAIKEYVIKSKTEEYIFGYDDEESKRENVLKDIYRQFNSIILTSSSNAKKIIETMYDSV